MKLDKKKFNNTIAKACEILSGDKKQCINEVKQCSNNTSKCKNEYINMFNSQPKQEDIVKCFSSSQKKTIKCIDKLKTNTKFNEYSAKSNHCIANKCPGIYNMLVKNKTQNTKKLKNITHSNTTQKNNVVKTKCKKESDELNNIFKKTNECCKKYDTFDEQQKCAGTVKIISNYSKCSKRYSNTHKPSNKSTQSKLSNKQ